MSGNFVRSGAVPDAFNLDPISHKVWPNDISRNNNKGVFDTKCVYNKPTVNFGGNFADRVRKFSPRTTELGEDILNRLKNQLQRESDMYSHPETDLEHNMQPRKADEANDWFGKEFGDMRKRNPMFQMPPWMSEDDDMANLASRMSHSPRFYSLGRRGGPRRERRNSGGSAGSGPSEQDHVDGPHQFHQPHSARTASSNAIKIPIRLEADAPPGWVPSTQASQPQPQTQQQPKQESEPMQDTENNSNHPCNQPPSASKTTPSMDVLYSNEVPRNTRCASAPPEMSDAFPARRHSSKDHPSAQNIPESPFSSSPVFNNVAKPYIAAHKMQENAPIAEEQFSDPPHTATNVHPPNQSNENMQYPRQQHYNQQHSYQPQSHQEQWSDSGNKSGVVRNIPIIFEEHGSSTSDNRTPSAPSPPNRSPSYDPSQQPQQQYRTNWEKPKNNSHFGFGPSFGFSSHDPFFDFPSGNHPNGNYQHQSQPPRQSYSHHQPQSHSQTHPSPHMSQQQPQSHPTQSHSHQPPAPSVPPAPPPEPIDIKMDQIAAVRNSVTELQSEVEKFEGTEKNKEFIYIDEMLTRALLQLDNVEPEGRDDIRQARKTLVKDINNTISSLEKKIEGDEKPQEESKEQSSINEKDVSNEELKDDSNQIALSKTEVVITLKQPLERKQEQGEQTGTTKEQVEQKQETVAEEPSATNQENLPSTGEKDSSNNEQQMEVKSPTSTANTTDNIAPDIPAVIPLGYKENDVSKTEEEAENNTAKNTT